MKYKHSASEHLLLVSGLDEQLEIATTIISSLKKNEHEKNTISFRVSHRGTSSIRAPRLRVFKRRDGNVNHRYDSDNDGYSVMSGRRPKGSRKTVEEKWKRNSKRVEDS